MRKIIFTVVLACWTLVSIGSGHVLAQDGGLAASQYTRKIWTTMDGLPVNHALDITEDNQGLIWLATNEGLVRFDGISFFTYNRANVPILDRSRIHRVVPNKSGVYFLTESSGLYQYKQGKIEKIDQNFGVITNIFMHAKADLLYVLTSDKFYVLRDNQKIFEGTSVISAMVSIIEGGVVYVTKNGYMMYNNKTNSVHLVKPEQLTANDIFAFYFDESTQQVYSKANIKQFSNQSSATQTSSDLIDRINLSASSVIVDPNFVFLNNGYLSYRRKDHIEQRINEKIDLEDYKFLSYYDGKHEWVTMSRRIYMDGNLFDILDAPIADIVIGKNGDIWLTTSRGLIRYKKSVLKVVSKVDGLRNDNLYWVYQTRTGQIYGSDLITDGFVSDGKNFKPFALNSDSKRRVITLFEDLDGNVWGGSKNICKIVNGVQTEECYVLPIDITPNAIYQQKSGKYWLSSVRNLYYSDDFKKGWEEVKNKDGSSIRGVYRIQELSNGEIWFGSSVSPLMRYKSGKMSNILPTGHACSTQIREILQDSAHDIWLGTESKGLCHLTLNDDGSIGEIQQVDADHGLFDNSVHRILDDKMGRFWMNTNFGIFWVLKKDLYSFLKGEIESVPSLPYTEEDGMLDKEGNGGKQNAGMVTSSGEIWFPTQKGLVILNPKEIPLNTMIDAKAYLVSMSVPKKTFYYVNNQVLEDYQRDITFTYSAISFEKPLNTFFRIRLEGYDNNWRLMKKERMTNYTNLKPGTYTFHVQAGVGGRWGQITSYTFTIEPYWYETWWFAFAIVLLVGVSAYKIVQFRTQNLTKQAEVLEKTVLERTEKNRIQQQLLEEKNEQLIKQTNQIIAQAEELKSIDDVKSRLFINLAHELRSPLTVVIEPLKEFQNRNKDTLSTDDTQMFETALRNSNRILELINKLLEIARLESGIVGLEVGQFNLVASVKDWINGYFSVMAKTKNIELVYNIPEFDFKVITDAEKLKTILFNLVSNAIKYSEPNTKVGIKIDLLHDTEQVSICVTDQGKGIPESELEHIFTWYYRSAEQTYSIGTGVGLSLSRELSKIIGGDLTVKSVLGGGSVFCMQFPRFVEASSIEESASSAKEPVSKVKEPVSEPLASMLHEEHKNGHTEHPLVMIVEDNIDIANMICHHLRKMYRVVLAKNGQEGLETALQELPDLIITDIMMPVMNGWEFIRAIRKIQILKATPIIVLTARTDAEGLHESLESGGDAYLGKPFLIETLVLQVNNLLALRREVAQKVRATLLISSKIEPQVTPDDIDHEFFQTLDQFVIDHLDDPDMSVDTIVKELGVSRSVLFRKIKAKYGESPIHYLTRMRMAQAIIMLKANTPATQVAMAVGYSSLSSFSKAFKAANGKSPSDVHIESE
jgi:signal transduction histidine kinase/CheY-like chemotaxis protein/ligand-binding sensor domain-containing protein/AraC-like DNA-binding protein